MQKLPRAIQRQVDEAARIEAQMAQEANNAAAEPSLAQVLAENPPPPPAAPAAPTEPPAQPPTPPKPAPDLWEHKYKTLQGMYDAQVPGLQAQLREALTQLGSLREQLNAVTKTPEPPPQEPSKPTADQRDIETFGEPLVDFVQRLVHQVQTGVTKVFHSQFAAVDQRLAKLEQTVPGVAQRVERTSEATFLAELTRLCPTWEQVNVADAFGAWLAQRDPIYGATRKQALDAAAQALDAQRVAAIFNAFIGQTPAAPPPNPLESQIAPAAGAAAKPVEPANTRPILSTRQIEVFYNDVARNRYRGREQEQARMEAEINLALAEGRVR